MLRPGSLLVIFLLLIAYGRCVADQFGILHASEASCCQVVCQDEHCTDEDNTSTGGHDSQPGEEDPAPCQLCMIISADGATFDASIKVPSPTVYDISDSTFFVMLSGHPSGQHSRAETLELPPYRDHAPPNTLASQWLQVVSRVFPVRGPSMA